MWNDAQWERKYSFRNKYNENYTEWINTYFFSLIIVVVTIGHVLVYWYIFTDELYIMSWELWLCEPPISYSFPLLSSLLIRKNTLNSIKKKNPSIICHFLFHITVLKYTQSTIHKPTIRNTFFIYLLLHFLQDLDLEQ